MPEPERGSCRIKKDVLVGCNMKNKVVKFLYFLCKNLRTKSNETESDERMRWETEIRGVIIRVEFRLLSCMLRKIP